MSENTYVILVEHPKASARKFSWVSVRKELLVDPKEARLGELAIGAVLSEAFVPLSDFALGDLFPVSGRR